MDAPAATTPRTLKRSLARTVELDTERGEVCKRFRNHRPLGRLLDGARARHEYATLRALSDRGCAVPTPRALRRADAGWEVVMDWLADTRSLASLLERNVPLPAGLAEELARLLASLHGAGLDHPDLHPGNVLVDEAGRAWAIDFHSARLRAGLSRRILLRDLVSLTAGAREHTSARFRARFFRAWHAALPPALATPLGNAAALRGLVEQVESVARATRRRVVEKRRLRWTRSGSACARVDTGAHAGFVRRELGEAERSELADLATGERTDPARPVHASSSERALLETWYAAARLCEHAVPSVRPLALLERPRRVAVFEWPDGAAPEPSEPVAGRCEPAELGFLLGTLHDRGLHARDIARAAVRLPAGGLALGPLAGLECCDGSRSELLRACAHEAGFAPQELAPGYAHALRGTRAERERWTEEIARG